MTSSLFYDVIRYFCENMAEKCWHKQKNIPYMQFWFWAPQSTLNCLSNEGLTNPIAFFIEKLCHFQFDAYFSLFFSKMSSKWPTALRNTANVFKIITCWLWNWLFLVPKTWTMIYTHLYTLVTVSLGFLKGHTAAEPLKAWVNHFF